MLMDKFVRVVILHVKHALEDLLVNVLHVILEKHLKTEFVHVINHVQPVRDHLLLV